MTIFLTVLNFLKSYWKPIALFIVVCSIFIGFKVQQKIIEQRNETIKKQTQQISFLEESIKEQKEQIEWYEASQQISSEANENMKEIHNHYETKIINNKEIVKEYYENPKSEELLKKLYQLINSQYSEMNLE